jgi:acyl-CoA thioesterase-2
MPHTVDRALREALLDGLDALLGALELERIGEDRFRVSPDTGRSPAGWVFGGQLLAQALVAAGATVSGKPAQSMHAAFVRTAAAGRPLDLVVNRVRDGRSMATRQVSICEDGKVLLAAIVSFHDGSASPDLAGLAPAAPPPEEVPLLQDWARKLPPDATEGGRHWVERPPPVEMRLPEAPSFLGGSLAGPTRSCWMRLPRTVGDDGLLNASLLAYASDFFLMDMVFHAHPATGGPGRSNGLSLDHAIWFHRPVTFDRWHLHTQETLAVVGNRGLAKGTIHSIDGHLVATVIQEVLVLAAGAR